MTERPQPKDISVTLSELQSLLHPEKRLVTGLKTSLAEAQQRVLTERDEGERRDGVILAYDPYTPAHEQMMRGIFGKRIAEFRQRGPVLHIDADKIAAEKLDATNTEGFPDLEDYARSAHAALERARGEPMDRAPYPVIMVDTYVDPIEPSGDEIHRIKEVLGDTASVAVEYSTSAQIARGTFALDQLLVNVISRQGFSTLRNMAVLIQEGDLEYTKLSYFSPWSNMVDYTSLKSLSPQRIDDMAYKFRDALQAQGDNIVTLVSGFQSGKTTFLHALLEEAEENGIGDITFIEGSTPLDQQGDALKGQVIFVDEAAALSDHDMNTLFENSGGKRVVLLYPDEDKKHAIVKHHENPHK